MRLDEEFKKLGYFWLPSNPDKKVPGTLIINDGGNIRLELSGLLEKDSDRPSSGIRSISDRDYKDSFKIKRIVGYIETSKLVTLDECLYINKKTAFGTAGSFSKATIYVNFAFLGAAYEENEPILFNYLQFSVEGIDEWVGRSGIKVEYPIESKVTSITYHPIKEITLNLNNGMKLQIIFTWTYPGFPIMKEAKITQKVYFKLSSKQECLWDDFISVVYKVTTLLCFAIDEVVCIEKVTATSEDIRQDIGNGKTRFVPISIYYRSNPFAKDKPKIDWNEMLFRFGDIQDNAERIFNNWFDAYNKSSPTLNLYFSTKVGADKYPAERFLALVQGLESYHRRTSNMKEMDEGVFEELKLTLIEQCQENKREWLKSRLQYGNEVSLRKRIKSIIKPFKELLGANGEIHNLIDAIVKTRNYLTHYDQSLERVAVKGRDLVILCLKVEVIFQLHLLQVLGFTASQVQSIFKNSYKLTQQFNTDY